MKKCPFSLQNGSAVIDDNNSISAGERGALTFDNVHLFEKLAHFNRERIAERVMHARGSGAYGTFTLAKDLSAITSANFLHTLGNTTKVFVRFSTVGGGQDSSDNVRDIRGFSVRFYTEEGNFDLVGNNTPVFFLRDPINFPDLAHAVKKDPRTNIPNGNRPFQFWARLPQSFHQLTILMSDRGIPYSYRYMHGFGSHTFGMYNDKNELVWVKWHLKSNQGIKNLTDAEAARLAVFHAQKDLVDAIDNGEYPSWQVKLQVMTQKEAETYQVNPFDLTKVWPHKDFPLIEIGTLELNKNVDNYFMEVEQVAFNPGNFVNGICASPDKMLQARLFAYPDAQRYRLGVNYNQLSVNKPRCPVYNYQRDGLMADFSSDEHRKEMSGINFYPNAESKQLHLGEQAPPALNLSGQNRIYDTGSEDNFSQAGDLFRLLTEEQRVELINNFANGLHLADLETKKLMISYAYAADNEYGEMLKKILAM
ncbi:MAG: catalase [Burkholderiales bacterium]|jgi:catalase|nr:catalase [Burkholderiales bacterium]